MSFPFLLSPVDHRGMLVVTPSHPKLTIYLILMASKDTIGNTKKRVSSITNKAQVE
jgi:hypothetical protein